MILATGFCYEVVSYKASHALLLISDLSCVPVWGLLISDSSTRALWLQQIPNSEAGIWWEIPLNIADEVPARLSRDLQYAVKSYDMEPTALLPLRRKACCRFLSPLKIYRPRPVLNSRNLGAVASMLKTLWSKKQILCKVNLFPLSVPPALLLDDSDRMITGELWWTNREVFMSISFHHGSPCSYITFGTNNRPLLAAVQRRSLTPSTR
jgi:hypothetical protein